jgi:uncharacterized delta-60 repeat protein
VLVLLTWLLWVVSAIGQTEVAGAAQLRQDRDFGHDGVVRASFGPTFEEGLSFTSPSLQPDGSVTALGQRSGSRQSHVLSSLVRFSPGGEAKRIRSFPDTTVTIARDPAGGWVRIVGLEHVERLKPDGQVDRSFGRPLGKQRWASDRAGFQIDTLLPLPSGEVLVAGGEYVARFRGDGSLDTQFGSEWPGSEGRPHVSLGRAVPGLSGGVVALLAAGEGRTIVVTSKPESQGPGEAQSHVLVLDRSGQLDPDFQPAVLNEEAIAARERSDGGVVLLGTRETGSAAGVRWISGTDIFVAELDRGGRLDPGFGGGTGVLQLDIGTIDEPRSLLVLADGSIAIGGSVVDAAHRCRPGFGICHRLPFVARLTPQGSLDPGFGSAGVHRFARLPGRYSSLPPEGVLGLTETTAGGLIAAGGSGPNAFVVRLTPRGRPDSRFGDDGVARERIPHRSETTVHSMASDSRGRLLVAGLTNAGLAESNRSAVFRFLPDGRRDRGFGGGRGFAPLRGEGEALELAPDRGGGAYVLSRSLADEMWIAHLRGSGSLDRRFGSGGFVELQLSAQGSTEAEGGSVRLHHLFARLPGGGLIVVGRSSKSGLAGSLEVRRLSARGHAVRYFGEDGVLVLGGPRLKSLLATDMEIGPEGDILITGALPKRPREDDGGERSARRLAVVKVLPEGRLDRRFGHDGVASPRVRGATRARTVIEADDGSLLLAAEHWSYAPVYPKVRPLLLRLDRDGHLEKRFGAAPTRGEERYEAAGHAKRMRQLIVTGKRVLLVSEDLPSLLAYDLDGRCEGYLPLSSGGGVRTTAAAGSGREVIVATHPFFSTGFEIVLRAFRAR